MAIRRRPRFGFVVLVVAVALSATGCQFFTWGAGEYGQLGDGSVATRPNPERFRPAPRWAQVDVGGAFTCAVRESGSLWCWGSNCDGELGIGSSGDPRLVPTITATPGPTSVVWTKVSAGGTHSARSGTGVASTAGERTERASSVTVTHPTPKLGTDGGGRGHDRLDGGECRRVHTCGIKAGRMWCWGDNDFGQVGDGTSTPRQRPMSIGTQSDWTSVSAGYEGTCAIRAGERWCWGNDLPRLGPGSHRHRQRLDRDLDQLPAYLWPTRGRALVRRPELDGQLGDGTTMYSGLNRPGSVRRPTGPV